MSLACNWPPQELDLSAMVVWNGHVAPQLSVWSAYGVIGIQHPTNTIVDAWILRWWHKLPSVHRMPVKTPCSAWNIIMDIQAQYRIQISRKDQYCVRTAVCAQSKWKDKSVWQRYCRCRRGRGEEKNPAHNQIRRFICLLDILNVILVTCHNWRLWEDCVHRRVCFCSYLFQRSSSSPPQPQNPLGNPLILLNCPTLRPLTPPKNSLYGSLRGTIRRILNEY